jgi:hypothetical protein
MQDLTEYFLGFADALSLRPSNEPIGSDQYRAFFVYIVDRVPLT